MATLIDKGSDYDKGKRWLVRYREVGGRTGKQREKSFRLKKEATDFKASVEHTVRDGSHIDPDKGSITVRAYWEEFSSRRHIAVTTEYVQGLQVERHSLPEFGHKAIRNVTPVDVERLFKQVQAGGLSVASAHTCVRPLKALFTQAVRDEWLTVGPFSRALLPPVPSRAVDETALPELADIEVMAKAVRADYCLAVWLMAGCGLRISEALAVQEADFHMKGGTRVLRVRRQVQKVKGADGKQHAAYTALQHRQPGDGRDVPRPYRCLASG